MLEKIPQAVGHALKGVRAGFEKVVSEDAAFADVPASITLASSAFADGGAIPVRHTADGEGVSPPLAWRVPSGEASALVLIVEDSDAPGSEPFVHLLAWGLPPEGEWPEGALQSPHHKGEHERLGRNTFLQTAWAPPDPPPGHGPHAYVFQMFALDKAAAFDTPPTRGALVRAMKGHVVARGVLVGHYERS